MSFAMMYGTGSLFMSMLPAIAMTTWLSFAGYIDLWILYVILMIFSFVFTIRYIVPIITTKDKGGV